MYAKAEWHNEGWHTMIDAWHWQAKYPTRVSLIRSSQDA